MLKRNILEIHVLVLAFMLVVWYFPTNFNFLIWNVFLAIVPFDLALWIRATKSTRWLKWGLTAVWVVFFPNTMYMVTDFSHLSSIGTGLMTETQFFNYAILASGVLMGMLFGMSSAHAVAIAYFGEKKSLQTLAFYAGLSLLSAFGIYLGRFLRLNSWELVTDMHGVLTQVAQAFTTHSLVFVVSFGALQLAILLMYHVLRKM